MKFSSNQFELEDILSLGGLQAVARRKGLPALPALPRTVREVGISAARGGGVSSVTGACPAVLGQG